jgi:small ligand-binding sensory domain FIST
MQISAAVSTQLDIGDACREAVGAARAALDGVDVDLCFLFVSGAYGAKVAEAPMLVTELADPGRLAGCDAGGVIGDGIEIEGLPAVSVTLIAAPDAGFELTHLITQDLPDDDAPPSEWVDLLCSSPAETNGIVVMPDPYSFATDRLLRGLDYAYPETPKIGGLASGGTQPGGNSLFLDQSRHQEGAIVVSMSGCIGLSTVVAQGCKPFGRIGRLTKVSDNIAVTIDDLPAMQFLQHQLADLAGRDREVAQNTPLFFGIALDPFATSAPVHGEFLIRNMLGFDPKHGSLAIGAELGVGRMVQFHLRDGRCSSEDLQSMLRAHQHQTSMRGAQDVGALLFSCLGRGEHLYGRPNHDSEMFHAEVGRIPLGGFFCNGEIGPVQGSTYLHGYTSAFGVLHEKAR